MNSRILKLLTCTLMFQELVWSVPEVALGGGRGVTGADLRRLAGELGTLLHGTQTGKENAKKASPEYGLASQSAEHRGGALECNYPRAKNNNIDVQIRGIGTRSAGLVASL